MDNNMNTKIIVITGATAGIGLAAAKALAGMGSVVIGVGRTPERCRAAELGILSEHPQARVRFLLADLASQRQVRALAGEIKGRVRNQGWDRVDVLVNNAGAVSSWYTTTEDGYEMTFAVNHLAPFLLTHELLPLLNTAPKARVLTVSSNAHRRIRIQWGDIMLRRRFHTLLAYKQSKLANVMFTAEFNRRYVEKTGIRAFAIDPGLVNTNIGLKGTAGIAHWFWDRRRQKGVTPEQGAETVIFLASDPSVSGSEAVFWKDCQPLAPSKYALREVEAARLWKLSERLCSIE